jgi:hypothetical protein
MRLEGGDNMDESGSPKQTDDYHLFSEGQPVCRCLIWIKAIRL